jgi:hypothetical protein
MTWVVAGLGRTYAYAVSDVRITEAGVPVEEFGVQKLVRLTDTAVLGFAGNVRIGLELMEGIKHEVERSGALHYENVPFEVLMFPFMAALEREYPRRYSEQERASTLDLLIISVRPSAEPPFAEPFGFLFRCPTAEKGPRIEYKQITEPCVFSIGSGAADTGLDRALDLIEDAAATWDVRLRGRTEPEDLIQIPLHAEQLLQQQIAKHRRAQALVGPVMVSLLITVEGIRWLTGNAQLPVILRGWPAVKRGLSARARGESVSTRADFARLLG